MKIFGIPTKIDPSFFILAVFLGAGRGTSLALILEWLVVVFVSVLLHELGHALTAKGFGLSPSITLYSMGGPTSWQSDKDVSPPKRLLISLAGPLAGFIFGGLIFLVGSVTANDNEVLANAYFDLLWVNIGWGIFNLLPLLPLDGGQVLLTLEEWILRRKTQIISHVISLMVALAIMYLAMSYRLLWIGILGAWFAFSNANFLIQRRKGQLDQKLVEDLEQVGEAIQRQELDRALGLARYIQGAARTSEVRQAAAWRLVFILIMQEKYAEAETELTKYFGLYGDDTYLRGILHFQRGDMAGAIPFLRNTFVQAPTSEKGTLLSKALATERKFVELSEVLKQPVMEEVKWNVCVSLQAEFFESGDFAVANALGVMAYELKPEANTAYNLACGYARAGEIAEGLKWLERAVEGGFNSRETLATDSDIEALRSSPEFERILSKVE